jgi:hypothetical protein
MGTLELFPVISKDLLEDAPVPRGFGHHRVAPSWSGHKVAVQRLYHAGPAPSTPHQPSQRRPEPPPSSDAGTHFPR